MAAVTSGSRRHLVESHLGRPETVGRPVSRTHAAAGRSSSQGGRRWQDCVSGDGGDCSRAHDFPLDPVNVCVRVFVAAAMRPLNIEWPLSLSRRAWRSERQQGPPPLRQLFASNSGTRNAARAKPVGRGPWGKRRGEKERERERRECAKVSRGSQSTRGVGGGVVRASVVRCPRARRAIPDGKIMA